MAVMTALSRLRTRDALLFSFLKRLSASHQLQLRPMSSASNLQQLPAPSLQDTINKFFKSVKPLVSAQELQKTAELLKGFAAEDGDGSKLHALLQARAAERNNWLEDWWLNTAYLEYRDPVVVFSSPGLVWPEAKFKSQHQQLLYTAQVIRAALEFNNVLNARGVPQEMIGTSPADMAQFYRIFGTTRIPQPGRDALSFQNPNSPSRTVVVLYKNHVFSLDVYNEDKTPLDASQILSQLRDVVQSVSSSAIPIGVLTSENRDVWAENYQILAKDQENSRSFRAIQDALFVVAIDTPTGRTSVNQQSLTGELLIHGFGGTRGNGGNRWYDKTVQFVIGGADDGVGITYEHSPAEGGPIGVMTDFVVERMKTMKSLKAATSYPKPQKLNFNIPVTVETAIADAAVKLDKLANDLEVNGFTFSKFGKNSLKKVKVSPDSFIQIAIQFAFYKVHQQPAAQYESASLRKFIGGRTDVIRTCSEEALTFCSLDPRTTNLAVRAKALRGAINAHKEYVADAMNMRGVDRHLLGLKLIAKENNLPVPKLYSDPAFVKSTHFRLSTSNVPAKCDGFMVYGPLVDDGYACCYNPRDETINFGTSAWRTNSVTNLTRYRQELESGLEDMLAVLQSENTMSKL